MRIGRPRERVGELIEKVGLRAFLKAVGLKPVPQMIKASENEPRTSSSKREAHRA